MKTLIRTLLAPALLALVSCAESTPPLNVVLIVIDDLGWIDTGVYGSSFYETPHIDQLAARGARFSQFYTASAVCSPTRASLMTGKHPARLDITNWIGGEQNGLLQQATYERQLPLEETTIGEAFRDNGYATGYVGKWHLGREGFMPELQGFDFTATVNHAGQPGSYFSPYGNENSPRTAVPDLEGDSAGSYLTDRLTDVSLDFIERNRDQPFFLTLSHYSVHTPLQAPEETVARYDRKAAALGPETEEHYESERDASTKLRQDHATYAAMIESTDESVGRIVEKIRELGIEEHTAVVFVSDNGGLSTLMRKSFNQATANMPLRAGKGWLYEGGIRAPLIVAAPGAPAGLDIAQPTTSNDLYPTLLELAGLTQMPEQHLDGESLASAIFGQGGTAERPLYWHFPHYHGSGNRPSGAIRWGDLKLIEWFEDGGFELYDLSADLGERRDLVGERPEDAARLLSELRRWRGEVGANMPTTR